MPFDIYWGYVSREVRLPSSGGEYKSLDMFDFIKPVSDTVSDTINAAYYDQPLILIRLHI